MRDTFTPDEEDERRARRPTRIEAGQPHSLSRLQCFGVGADDVLGEKGQRLQIGRAAHARCVEAQAREQFAVVRHVLLRMDKQRPQTFQLESSQAVGRPPLTLLQMLTHAHGVVLLQFFLQGEYSARNQPGVDAGGWLGVGFGSGGLAHDRPTGSSA